SVVGVGIDFAHVYENLITESGMGIIVGSLDYPNDDARVHDNVVSDGGSGYAVYGSRVQVHDNLSANNDETGILVWGADMTVTDTTAYGGKVGFNLRGDGTAKQNVAHDFLEIGILAVGPGDVPLADTLQVRNNTVYRTGTGIKAGSHAWIDQNLVHSNGVGI